MLRYIVRRLLEMLPTTFGVLLLTFALFHVVGGSPAEIVLGKNASAEALANFDARYGYDKPLLLGRWSPVRALDATVLDKLEREPRTRHLRLPLAYGLPAGAYRLNTTRVVLVLRHVITGAADEVVVDGRSPLTFTVREGWKAIAVEIAGADSEVVRLEQGNKGWFDTRFFNFLKELARGDLGFSTEHNLPVATVLREGVGPSLSLTIPILVGGALLALMLAMLCAAWRGGVTDGAILVFSTLLMSVNYVVWVLAGQFLLAFRWRLFPVWGFESAAYLVLPVLIGIFSGLGRDLRFYRTVLLDELYKPYVRTAQAKGVSGLRIMIRHVLRNSLIPIITYISLSVPFLFTGSLLLESFFGIPGLGSVSINAINSSDMAIVRAVVLLGALLYQVVNLAADLCYGWLDPRVRLG